MKSVLISTRPQWVEKICHKIGEDETGKAIYEKRIEVRKTAPKEVPFKAYIYETQGQYIKFIHGAHTKYGYGCGKVIGEFVCDRIDEAPTLYISPETVNMAIEACLNVYKMCNYGKDKPLYGWHISDLKIYDRPRELSEFRKPCDRFLDCFTCRRLVHNEYMSCDNKITRPPQSWCYVEELQRKEE